MGESTRIPTPEEIDAAARAEEKDRQMRKALKSALPGDQFRASTTDGGEIRIEMTPGEQRLGK